MSREKSDIILTIITVWPWIFPYLIVYFCENKFIKIKYNIWQNKNFFFFDVLTNFRIAHFLFT